MSSLAHSLCGGCGGNDVEFWVRPAQSIQSWPLNFDKFTGFRTFRSAVTTVTVAAVTTLRIV